jgi:hypothetical protein
MYINAHIFNTIELANEAISLINKGEGIPVSDDSVTRTYTQVQENDGYIYITADEVTEKYLGKPTEISIFENIEM